MSEKLDELIADEALCPELSDESFQINGKIVKITPLKIRYQKQFKKALTPLAASVITDLAEQDWTAALVNSMEYAEIMPELVKVLCHNGGYLITDEELDECTMQPEEQLAVIMKFAAKNEAIGKPVTDFFTNVYPLALKRFAEVIATAQEKVVKGLETATTTF